MTTVTVSSVQTTASTGSMGSLIASFSGTGPFETIAENVRNTVRNQESGSYSSDIHVYMSESYNRVTYGQATASTTIERAFLLFYMDGTELLESDMISSANIEIYVTSSVLSVDAECSIRAAQDLNNQYPRNPISNSDYIKYNYEFPEEATSPTMSSAISNQWVTISLNSEMINNIYNYGYLGYLITSDVEANGNPNLASVYSFMISNYKDPTHMPRLVLTIYDEDTLGIVDSTSARGMKCLRLGAWHE